MAEALGTPLMAWQRYVADVAMEIDPATGRLAYDEVDLTTMRQQGKSRLLLAVMVHRARHWPGSRVLYAAQSRIHAHSRWEDVHVRALDRSRYAGEYTVRRQRGDEAVRWRNGSWYGITAPGETAGHGDTLDLGVVDEAWVHEDARLEQGMSPTMVTRPEAQLWVASTAGTVRSSYLRGKVDRGRALASGSATVVYFEWSAPPDADPADPRTWRSYMPALGITIAEAKIASELERLALSDFARARAYCNLWPGDIPSDWHVISEATWRGLAMTDGQGMAGPVAFAADTTPERSWSTIAAAGRRPDGRSHVEVIAHEQGTAWVVPRLVKLHHDWRPCAVVVDATGPAGSLIAPLEAAGIEVVRPRAPGTLRAPPGRCTTPPRTGRCGTRSTRRWTPPSRGPRSAGSATRGRGRGARRWSSVPWSRARWPRGATPPGRTCTRGSRASTCEPLSVRTSQRVCHLDMSEVTG